MQQFPTAAQLNSWAGLCPANHESAGVKKQVRANRGNVWLKVTLIQSAWAATNRKGSRLQARYHALRVRCETSGPSLSLVIDASTFPDMTEAEKGMVRSEMESQTLALAGNSVLYLGPAGA